MESITGKIFEAMLLFILEVSFEFIEFFSTIILLFLSSFVLRSLCSIVIVYRAIHDLVRVFFPLSLSRKKYASICKVSICDLSEDITSYAPGELRFISRLYFSCSFETSSYFGFSNALMLHGRTSDLCILLFMLREIH